MKLRRLLPLAALVLVGGLALTGCTQDKLAQQNGDADNKGYIAGDGQVTEYPVAKRGKPIEFTTRLVDGKTKTADDYRGKVLVVNFWYASCPPCRLEAPVLQKISQQTSATAAFLGVDVHDENDTIDAFARTFKIGYDNTSDVRDAHVQLAFAGARGPNSTPTTIVLDPEGRVSSRILGEVDPSTLNSLITTAAAKPSH